MMGLIDGKLVLITLLDRSSLVDKGEQMGRHRLVLPVLLFQLQ